jgi:predicted TIM-barrel fold metal-dependent hydrolase
MINCHLHTFRDEDVPVGFLPLGLCKILSTKVGYFILSRLLTTLNPFSNKDKFDRYVKFLNISKLGGQKEIFNECKKFYPEGTKFVILPMDMAFMGAGRVPREYERQIDELAILSKEDDSIIPFIHVDPRRKGMFDLFQKAIEEYGFKGMKLYPPLGVFPYDISLFPFYTYCSRNNIPVISHGSPFNPVHFKGKRKDLLELLEKSQGYIDTKGKSEGELCSYFTHPKNYENILREFPNLRICIAHFGSEYYWDKFINDPGDDESWFTIIRKMIAKYPNFFTDISFTMENKSYWDTLKVLLVSDESINKKILFGSDFYMVETEATEREFSIGLRAHLGEDLFKLISETNPNKFLFNK